MDASPATSSSDQTSHPAADAPAAPDAAAAAEVPRRRAMPAGVSWLGFATAGIGLVLAALGIASLIISRDNGVSALDARLAGVELRLRDLSSRPLPAAVDPKALDEVASRVAKLEAAAGATPQAPASDSALAARIAALEAELKVMAETMGNLGRRTDELLAAAREARARADATAAALAELAQKIPAATATERSALEALANRVSAVERSEKAVERSDRTVRLAVAASALNAAVARGDAFAAELATVKVLGSDPRLVEALEPFARTGVPPTAALAREFSELAPSLRQASGASPREGALGKLQMNAEKLIRIRRVDEPAGSDPAAIVARAEAKVSRGDIAGALSELVQLPPDARAPAEAWIKRAQARTAALDASRRLAADALSGLGK